MTLSRGARPAGTGTTTSPGTAVPASRFGQPTLLALAGYTDPVRRGFFLRSGIEGRHLYMDGDRPRADEDVDELTARFQEGSLVLGAQAVRACLARADLDVSEVDRVRWILAHDAPELGLITDATGFHFAVRAYNAESGALVWHDLVDKGAGADLAATFSPRRPARDGSAPASTPTESARWAASLWPSSRVP
jgi:hypothetical protein